MFAPSQNVHCYSRSGETKSWRNEKFDSASLRSCRVCMQQQTRSHRATEHRRQRVNLPLPKLSQPVPDQGLPLRTNLSALYSRLNSLAFLLSLPLAPFLSIGGVAQDRKTGFCGTTSLQSSVAYLLAPIFRSARRLLHGHKVSRRSFTSVTLLYE